MFPPCTSQVSITEEETLLVWGSQKKMSHAVYKVKGPIHPETYFLAYPEWYESMQVVSVLFAHVVRYWSQRIATGTTLSKKSQ